MSLLTPWLTPTYHKITQAFDEALGHHALLIRADDGLGVEQLCSVLAKRLMCLTPKGGEACGECHACHLMQANSHPDFQPISPIENKDIGVDQIRAMNEQATQHAQQNGNKVIYLNEYEYDDEKRVIREYHFMGEHDGYSQREFEYRYEYLVTGCKRTIIRQGGTIETETSLLDHKGREIAKSTLAENGEQVWEKSE